MINSTTIIETWNALPETDRTSGNVHSRLLEQGHPTSHIQVRTVLCATVLSEMLDDKDVRVTVRTLNTLLDLCSHSFAGKIEISGKNIDYAECLTNSLRAAIGPGASDLTQALARLSADYDMAAEIASQLRYIEMMHDLKTHGEDDLVI